MKSNSAFAKQNIQENRKISGEFVKIYIFCEKLLHKKYFWRIIVMKER